MSASTDRIQDFIGLAKSIKADTERLWQEQGLSAREVKTVSYNFETETISVNSYA